MGRPPEGGGARGALGAYWRRTLRLTAGLLAVWFATGYVLAILLAPALNRVTFLGGPLGYWVAQNGAIYVFWLLILVYARAMNRLDREFGVHDEGEDGGDEHPEMNIQDIAAAIGLTFALYIGIAIWSRVSSTKGFYVAGHGVPPLLNGMATAADWMSAASFISMAGLIAFLGFDGAIYLLGWTGGYVLLALLLAPFLRKFGKFTVPAFIGARYYSGTARVVAAFCATIVSFTYVAGQMRGAGIVFSRFLEIPIGAGVIVGMAVVAFYAILGGMKGITYTQVAQYVVLITAFLIPAVGIAVSLTGIPLPQIAFPEVASRLDAVVTDLGFDAYTSPFTEISRLNVFLIVMALMCGTAGLPHVIIRFYTTRTVSGARWTGVWALLFIGLLYTTAPAVAAFARFNLVDTVVGRPYAERPEWFRSWEETDLIRFADKDADGIIDYALIDYGRATRRTRHRPTSSRSTRTSWCSPTPRSPGFPAGSWRSSSPAGSPPRSRRPRGSSS